MRIDGEFRARSAAARVYAFFNDPVAFTDCLDDPHQVHAVDPDHFEGTVTSGIGFIRGTFRIRGTYHDRTPPGALGARIQGSGLGSGIDADLSISLVEDAGATTVRWGGEVKLSGPIATLGERMVRGTVEKKAGALFENARRKLETP
jgi:uncharacterized protein